VRLVDLCLLREHTNPQMEFPLILRTRFYQWQAALNSNTLAASLLTTGNQHAFDQ
jgi:hypothetical protein